ncbi:MAG: putative lipoprotein YmbA [Alteromonadaceae bacterium]|jgi:uncharacterized lipoprotein YmbA
MTQIIISKISLSLSILCLLSLLSSCATAPITVSYYTLNSIRSESSLPVNKAANEQQPIILLSAINLADFLATGALVRQLKSHQIQLSNQHRWADNLTYAITRSLLSKLEVMMPKYHFEKNDLRWKNQAQAYLKININQFTVLADNTTLTSGTFWLLDKENKLLRKQSFRINKQLSQAGYNHAVVQLELSINTLAQQISPLLDAHDFDDTK